MRRLQFSIIEYNLNIIFNLAKNGHDFAKIWKSYLNSCGWDEDSFEQEMILGIESEN